MEGIYIDGGPQQTLNTEKQTLNTEKPWLNVIIAHSKFIPSPFICLFSMIIPSFSRPYIETT